VKRIQRLLMAERKSTVIPAEDEIAQDEAAMAKGLKKNQEADLKSYHERERTERQERINERQELYDKTQV
jgi:hypothetical protein